MQGKKENLDTAKNTKLDLKVIYDICEEYGISKEIISIFTLFERRIKNEQYNTRT